MRPTPEPDRTRDPSVAPGDGVDFAGQTRRDEPTFVAAAVESRS